MAIRSGPTKADRFDDMSSIGRSRNIPLILRGSLALTSTTDLRFVEGL